MNDKKGDPSNPGLSPGFQRSPDEPNLFVSFSASYLLGLSLIVGLVFTAGFWEVVANTRALAALIASGIIALGEDDPGLGTGVPAVNLWIRSQEPVTWLLVLLSVILFIAVALLKGVQFHRIARFVGIEGSFGQHMRAFIYGHGIGRMLPYRAGEVAWASALKEQGGATLLQAAQLVFIFKGFLLFEIATFAVIGFILAGLLDWAISLMPPLAILVIAWLLTRRKRNGEELPEGRWATAGRFIAALSKDPQVFVGLVLLSLLSFSLVEFASYIVPQAFTTPIVLLVQDELRFVVVTPPVIIMAVVGGYLSRLIPVTPGGIGQFELGFALVLAVNALPLSAAVVVALLVSSVRYLTGALVFGITMMAYGIETDLNRVLTIFKRPITRPAEGAV